MALIDNLSLKNLKNLNAFQAETLTRGRQRRLSRRKAVPWGTLGGPRFSRNPGAQRRPRGGEDAEEGFPGWGTNGGATTKR